jgi:ribosomal-protein-alanine N-acetyltransferase
MRRLVRGERSYLRRPERADGRELVALNRASRSLHRGWVSPPVTIAQFSAYLRRCDGRENEGLLLCRLADDAIVGVVNFNQIFRGALKSAYIGYYMGKPFAGAGFMSEGVGLALRHGFRRLRLHRVEANIQPGNEASRRVVTRNGFRLEGYSPRYLKVGGRWRDHERWAALADARPDDPQHPAGRASFARSRPRDV